LPNLAHSGPTGDRNRKQEQEQEQETQGTVTPKPTRKDALGNRERILTAAREALAASSGSTSSGSTSSGSTSLTAIARNAGVGIGTLYRHFPSREALIVELYRHDIQYLIDLAPALLRSQPPLTALRNWFGEVARYGQLKYGAAEIIHAATSDDEYYEPFVHAIAILLDNGAAAGQLKQGLDPEDVLLQLSVLWRIDPERGGEARAARILDLIIDGLRVNRTTGTQGTGSDRARCGADSARPGARRRP
jgi:AcrR family transcriptional regulator